MIKIDIHTHVLPGIDDGAKDWDVCLEMLARSAACGVKTVIATPHYVPWKQKCSPKEIEELCLQAEKKLLQEHGITMDIHYGNEIYYNTDAIRKVKEGKILTLAGTRYVLVEFEPTTSYQTFCRAVREFRDAGYIPILAHVERYERLRQAPKIQELKRMGALFQMNLEVLDGGFFDRDSRWSKKCLLEEKVDFLASDMHGLDSRTPMTEEALLWVRKHLNPKYQKELLYENAQNILHSIDVKKG